MENQTVYGQNMLISQTFIATAWKGVKIKHIHTFPAALAAAHRGGREKEQNLGRYVEGSRRKLVGRKLRPKNKCCQLFGFVSALSAGKWRLALRGLKGISVVCLLRCQEPMRCYYILFE